MLSRKYMKTGLGKKKGIPLQTRKANAIKQKERDGPCNAMKTLTAFVGHNGIGEFRVKEPSKSAF